jgi:hypothetical protein
MKIEGNRRLSPEEFAREFEKAKLKGHDLMRVCEWENDGITVLLCFDRSRRTWLLRDGQPYPISLYQSASLAAGLIFGDSFFDPLIFREWLWKLADSVRRKDRKINDEERVLRLFHSCQRPENAGMAVELTEQAGHYSAEQRKDLAGKFVTYAIQLMKSVDIMEPQEAEPRARSLAGGI